jgi:dTDP-4-dehydrorhamnose 3,5-epimerase
MIGPATALEPLPVARCRLLALAPHPDPRGSLIAIEEGTGLPFPIARVYVLYGTALGTSRGFHSHRRLRQWAICVAGSCTFLLDDGEHQHRVRLQGPELALEIGPMVWREMHDFSPDAVLMVVADSAYDETDYLRDHAQFLAAVRENGA